MPNLYYFVNGKVQETILSNVPRPLAKWKKNQLLATNNYKLGLLIIKNNKN